jgi:hypothetical protein
MSTKQKIMRSFVVLAILTGLNLAFSLMIPSTGTVSAQTNSNECTPDGGDSDSCPQDEQAGGRSDYGAETDCEPGDPDCCGGVKTTILTSLCKDDKDGGVILGLLKAVLAILTAGVGVAAVGGIGYGALLYTTAENKPEQTKKAIGIIMNVVIGLAAYALMYLFLNFLIPGGIFS